MNWFSLDSAPQALHLFPQDKKPSYFLELLFEFFWTAVSSIVALQTTEWTDPDRIG